MIRALVIVAVLTIEGWGGGPAFAHDWYTGKRDPAIGWLCCGTGDCNTWAIRPGSITAEAEGYRVRLTAEEAHAINPNMYSPIDALVAWNRVQASETNDWNICINPSPAYWKAGGVPCLFAPPST